MNKLTNLISIRKQTTTVAWAKLTLKNPPLCSLDLQISIITTAQTPARPYPFTTDFKPHIK